MSRLLLSVVLPAVRAHRWIGAAATVVLAAIAVGVPHEARAQDSCSSGNFEVMPCVLGETRVNSGGTAQFEIYNYYYGDDYYYVTPSCSGIVYGCSSGGYYNVPAYSSGNVSVNFRVSSYGVGYVDADIVSDYGGGDVNVEETVYGQAMLAIDSAQTILSTADQPMGRCAAACFTAGTSISTVPFYTLGQARNVTLVYNEDRAHPRPFIYAIVSPAADGPTVSSYSMTATLNGTAVQFSNGDYTLNFTSPGTVPVRLGGQISLSPGIPDIYDLVVSVVAQYSNAGSGSASYTTKLVVYDAGGSFVARGWSIANINKLDCDWYPSWRGCIIYGGDGSVEHYQGSFPSYQSADHATLTFNYGNNHYERKFPDGSIDQYDGGGYMTASIDPYGRATTFGYNGAGRLTQIVDPRHNAGASVPYIQLGYDSNGRLHTITETGGPGPSRTTTVWVDGNLNLWAVTDPDGQSSYVSYDGSNRLSATTDRRGGATYYGYDWAGKLASVVAPSVPVNAGGGSTTMQSPTTYYSAWQTVGVPSSSTAGTPFYAQAARDITGSVNAPGGRTTSFGVNDWGEATVVFDPAGQMTYASYDARVPKRIRRPDGSLTAASYDALDRLTMSQTAGQAAAYYYYNSVSQVDSVRGASVVATNYHYNPDNTLASGDNAAGVSMSYSYNASKQFESATDNGGHTTTYGYDNVFGNQNSVTAPGNRTMTSTMDVYGRVSTVTAPTRATVTTTYDLMNRPYQVTEAGRPATTFGYDALFNTSVADARGNVTTMAFDALGRASSRTDPNNATETFRYDIAGRKTSWTNRRGQTMTYGYDADDRLTSRTGSGIADSYSYATVENMTIAVAQNSVEVDSLFSTTAVGGTTSDLDSVVTHVNGARYQVLHNHPGSLSAPYTLSVSTSSGVSIRTRSTALNGTTGLVNSISDGFNIAYPGYNGEALPNSLYNPVNGTTSATYMSLHAPSETSFSDGTLESTFGRSNHYDALGRVDLLNSLGAGTQHAYYYNQYGELTDDRISAGCYGSVVTPDEGANYANCTSNAGWTRYSYDAVGNRTDLGATYYYGNRLGNFNGGFLNYDADGNVSQKYGIGSNPHNQLFYWNPESRLDSVSYDGYLSVRYEYNALGKPVKKYRQGALDRVWLWDGEQLLAEFAPSNARIVDYQYSGTDAPYAYTYGPFSASGVRYHEQDALGNVIGTHEGTSVTQTVSYDAWGVPSVSGNNDSHLMWKGLVWEGDVVGLYYMRGRWYDPELGRFIQEDPIHSGVNDYVFANNDPVNGSDPSGMDGQTCTEWDLVTRIDGVEVSRDYLETTCSGGDGNSDGGGGGGGAVQPQPKPPNNGRNCSPASSPSHTQYALAASAVTSMTAQFFSGFGSSDITYGPQSAASQVMAQSAGVQDVLNRYYMVGKTNGLYTFGTRGLIAAGNNAVAQFVGSFTYNITPGNGGINLSLSNYTSVHSLTNGLFDSHSRSSRSPLGTTHQTYNLSIPCH